MRTSKYRWLSERTQVKNSNIPFGLGWDVHFLSDYPGACAGHFLPTQRLHAMVKSMTGRDFDSFAGITISHEETKSLVIVVARGMSREDVTIGRLLEVTAHECSHAADQLFARCEIVPCTELRAYTTDWLFGMCGAALLPELWAPRTLTALV